MFRDPWGAGCLIEDVEKGPPPDYPLGLGGYAGPSAPYFALGFCGRFRAGEKGARPDVEGHSWRGMQTGSVSRPLDERGPRPEGGRGTHSSALRGPARLDRNWGPYGPRHRFLAKQVFARATPERFSSVASGGGGWGVLRHAQIAKGPIPTFRGAGRFLVVIPSAFAGSKTGGERCTTRAPAGGRAGGVGSGHPIFRGASPGVYGEPGRGERWKGRGRFAGIFAKKILGGIPKTSQIGGAGFSIYTRVPGPPGLFFPPPNLDLMGAFSAEEARLKKKRKKGGTFHDFDPGNEIGPKKGTTSAVFAGARLDERGVQGDGSETVFFPAIRWGV